MELSEHNYTLVESTLDNKVSYVFDESNNNVLLQNTTDGSLRFVPVEIVKTKFPRKQIEPTTTDSHQLEPQIEPDKCEDSNSDEENDKSQIQNPKLWHTERTLALLHHYKDNEKAFNTGLKKVVWNRIAKKLNEDFGELNFNAKNVEGKWKTMKRTYKSIKLKNSKTGNYTHRWEYFTIMDELFHKRPEISPPAVCTSTSLIKADAQQQMDKAIPSTSESDDAGNNQLLKRRHVPNVNDRHKEKMAKMDRFLDSFDRLIEKL